MAGTKADYDLKALTLLGVGVAPKSQKLHTPRKLQLAVLMVCVVAILFFFAVENATSELHNAIKTVGHDSAPSIILAEQVKGGLADMDACVANELIAHPGQDTVDLVDYDKDRKQVADDLVSAAKNITYGDAEQIPIQTIAENLENYEAYVAQARVFHKRGGDPEVLPSYHQATLVMDDDLLPAADALDKANYDVMTRVYADHKSEYLVAVTLVWLTGLALIGTLFSVQAFLLRRMRRLFNPLLCLATLAAIGYLIFATASFHEEAIHIKVAKEDCFDSIYPLWHARAIAYNANAAESRWLLDPSYGTQSQNNFFTDIGELATLGPSETYESLADLASNVHVNAGQWPGQVPTDFHGYLADEMRNITFSGEKEAVVNTMRTLGVYVGIDSQIRQLQNSGKHADAVALCDGENPGQSDYAFNQFDTALGSVIDINKNCFDLAIARGDAELVPFTWLTPVACLSIVALALFGVLPRMREYHFSDK